MMNNYAIVTDGVVSNIVVWNGDTDTWSPPEGSQAVPVPEGLAISIGDTYSDQGFLHASVN